ncbi:hypothetical protein QZH41_019048 [Actinostola sp. cb2023]|nr:hypothetical protein QZH41_019048 [Actinostola sp. cb2023]
MASLFAASPFSSPVGQRIERATDGGLASEDWALNLEICDIINETDEGPKDASKAIRKRLANNKNFKSVILTLTVLESCVKNCGRRFHVLIAKKDFLDDLVRILSPKINAPQVVQEKILSLIQDWADAFRNSPDMTHVLQAYEALKKQGIEFPPKNLDTLSPIFTPERSQPEPSVISSTLGTTRPSTSPSHQPPAFARTEVPPPAPVQQPPIAMTGPVIPTPEQLAKLRSELDIVQGNVQVMSEMLTQMTPGQEEAGDLELLQELNRTCRAMQQRLLELLEQVANEEVVGELLRINDDLNNVFIRYDRYERFRQAQSKPAEPPRPAASAAPAMPPMPTPPLTLAGATAKPEAASDSLISFDEDPNTDTQPVPPQDIGANGLPAQFQGLEIKKTTQEPEMSTSVTHEDEFDMFAQSRKSTFEESRKAGATYSDNQQPFDRVIADSMSVEKPTPSLAEAKTTCNRKYFVSYFSAMESIETWLGEEENKQEGDTETMSSQDFDQFLAQRAAAEGQRTGSTKSVSQRPKQRQMQMENKDDDIFGL